MWETSRAATSPACLRALVEARHDRRAGRARPRHATGARAIHTGGGLPVWERRYPRAVITRRSSTEVELANDDAVRRRH